MFVYNDFLAMDVQHPISLHPHTPTVTELYKAAISSPWDVGSGCPVWDRAGAECSGGEQEVQLSSQSFPSFTVGFSCAIPAPPNARECKCSPGRGRLSSHVGGINAQWIINAFNVLI